jgi:hypothetical protein
VKGVFNEDWLKKRKRKRGITRGAWKPPKKKGKLMIEKIVSSAQVRLVESSSKTNQEV